MALSINTVAQMYADGATTGSTRNMYIEGDTIYSYGPHFPIAKRIPGGYVVNSNSYSISTAKHKSNVCGHIANHILWELPGCDMDSALATYTQWVREDLKVLINSRQRFSHHLERLEFNFGKAIEAHEKLGQDIQPLYNIMSTDTAAAAIKRIKKEGKIPKVMLIVFGKSKFFAKDKDARAGEMFWAPTPRSAKTIDIHPYSRRKS